MCSLKNNTAVIRAVKRKLPPCFFQKKKKMQKFPFFFVFRRKMKKHLKKLALKKIGICFLKIFFVKTFFQVGMFQFWYNWAHQKLPTLKKTPKRPKKAKKIFSSGGLAGAPFFAHFFFLKKFFTFFLSTFKFQYQIFQILVLDFEWREKKSEKKKLFLNQKILFHSFFFLSISRVGPFCLFKNSILVCKNKT